jgi:hypothetical protein
MKSYNNTKDCYGNIHKIIEFWTIEDFRDHLKEWFVAALKEKYTWRYGSAGNLFFFYSQVLTLIQSGHLLSKIERQKERKEVSDKVVSKRLLLLISKLKNTSELPILQPHCIVNPFPHLDEVYKKTTIDIVTQNLQNMLEASLSNYSITEVEDDSEKLFDSFERIKMLVELIYAAYILNSNRLSP